MVRKRQQSIVNMDFYLKAARLEANMNRRWNNRKANLTDEEVSRKESLRLALITNEKDAGRVSAVASVYQPFILGALREDEWGGRYEGVQNRVEALETACAVGYDTPEETVSAASVFADHLAGKND